MKGVWWDKGLVITRWKESLGESPDQTRLSYSCVADKDDFEQEFVVLHGWDASGQLILGKGREESI